MSFECLDYHLVMCVVAVDRRAGTLAEVKLVDYHCSIKYSFIAMHTITCMIVVMFANVYGQHVKHQRAWCDH